MIRTIARRVRSRTTLFPALLPYASIVGFLFGLNIFMDAQVLTPGQEANAEMGDASAQITLFDIEIPAGTSVGKQLADRAQRANQKVNVLINSIDFPFYANGARGIFFQEGNWRQTPSAARFRLVDGRWPADPGEVVIVTGQGLQNRVGDSVPVLGDANALRVVGVALPRWDGSPSILAASGTWETLTPAQSGTALSAFPTFEISGGSTQTLAVAVRRVVEETETIPRRDVPGLQQRVAQAVRSRTTAAAEAKRLWSVQSPLSLRAPGILLVPTTVLFAYFVLIRRMRQTIKRAISQGVKRRDAVTALWLVALPATARTGVLAAAVGTAVGWILAIAGTERWGYYVANWRLPWSAIVLVIAGSLVAILIAWGLVNSLAQDVAPSRAKGSSARRQGFERFGRWRRAISVAMASVSVWTFATMNSGFGAFLFVTSILIAVALGAPDAVPASIRLLPERTLRQKLVARQLTRHQARFAVAVTAYVTLTTVSIGFLIALASYSEELNSRFPPGPPPGQLLVDNDGAPFQAVDQDLRQVIESVPATRNIDPVQFFLVGRRVQTKEGVPVTRQAVGTRDFPTYSFAFDSPKDVEVAFGRNLTADESAILVDGGLLVVQPDRVRIQDGQVDVIDVGTSEFVARLTASYAEPLPTPWADVPFVLLRDTATELGLPTQRAALLYSGLSDSEATSVQKALAANGYSPRLVNKHVQPPSVVPASALIASGGSLLLLAVVVSALMTRAQVQDMRGWAAHLTRLGVRSRWARSALNRQYLWMMALALPLGLVTVLGSVQAARFRLPQLELVVPWWQTIGILGLVVLATLLGASMSARRLQIRDESDL